MPFLRPYSNRKEGHFKGEEVVYIFGIIGEEKEGLSGFDNTGKTIRAVVKNFLKVFGRIRSLVEVL